MYYDFIVNIYTNKKNLQDFSKNYSMFCCDLMNYFKSFLLIKESFFLKKDNSQKYYKYKNGYNKCINSYS